MDSHTLQISTDSSKQQSNVLFISVSLWEMSTLTQSMSENNIVYSFLCSKQQIVDIFTVTPRVNITPVRKASVTPSTSPTVTNFHFCVFTWCLRDLWSDGASCSSADSRPAPKRGAREEERLHPTPPTICSSQSHFKGGVCTGCVHKHWYLYRKHKYLPTDVWHCTHSHVHTWP